MLITIGEDGVTEEHIVWLEELDHDEHLQQPYTEENRDYATENKKVRFSRGDENIPDDPMNAIATNSSNPEILFDEEEVMDP